MPRRLDQCGASPGAGLDWTGRKINRELSVIVLITTGAGGSLVELYKF
jgi:hypothetical protein